MRIPPEWVAESFCYVTSRGRRSGTPHTIEIWFGIAGNSLYLLAEGRERADWVRNIRADPHVTVKVQDVTFGAIARFVENGDEEDSARRILATKYQDWSEGTPLSDWARTALVVALDPI